ncbi:class I SAM-dependent methyltransferase, partial [Propylenella binzhouense]|uniref:class I SAM-dependent methyltransferase n=1 Tax=Propylenella binzhouense TaxID=2555902 RepID=UPI00136F89F1
HMLRSFDPAEASRNAASPLVVDLGCGTGATPRALGPRLPTATRWRLVDRDPALLAIAAARHPGAETIRYDLAEIGGRGTDLLDGASLVAASALFDIVSRDWAMRLVDALAARRLPLYAALTYDGRMRFAPAHPADGIVHAAFDADQAGVKGFGPSLGPAGAGVLAAALAGAGYRVSAASSPWRLGSAERALSDALVRGIAAA